MSCQGAATGMHAAWEQRQLQDLAVLFCEFVFLPASLTLVCLETELCSGTATIGKAPGEESWLHCSVTVRDQVDYFHGLMPSCLCLQEMDNVPTMCKVFQIPGASGK